MNAAAGEEHPIVAVASRGAPLRTVAVAALLAFAASAASRADDTEIFLNQAANSGVRPNVLFIVDTSGSMTGLVALPKAPYDSATTYPGSCSAAQAYLTRATQAGAAPPACDDPDSAVPLTSNRCAASARALSGVSGIWTGRIAQWSVARLGWREVRGDLAQPLECEADAGQHGDTEGSPRRWARNGDDANRWTAEVAAAVSWSAAQVYTLYSANYLNWYASAGTPAEVSRLDIVKAVGTSLAYSIDGVNLGLMRFSRGPSFDPVRGEGDSDGGMVTQPVTDIAATRAIVTERLRSYNADGLTPLSETLYEAGQYLAGRAVDYGLRSDVAPGEPLPSTPESRRPENQALYQSPIQFQCQRNFIVLLTDGEPIGDVDANDKIAALPGFNALGRNSCDGDGDGACLDDMAQYLNEAADLAPGIPGRQNAVTYTIGFGPDVGDAGFLARTAARGGGRALAADNVTDLTQALRSIFGDILQSGSTFVSPSVSINAFNRTQSNNELFVSVFRPDDSLRWLGNVKKYGVRNGRIVDATGADAVDAATGFISERSRSLWSAAPETDVITSGGAVSRLPDPTERKLFTYAASGNQPDLTAAINALSTANTAGVPDAALNLPAAGDPTRGDLMDWARGIDRPDADQDGDRDEVLRTMGDPLHARPALVTYGGTAGAPLAADSVVYVPTNDGFIHALDARTGRELWAFIPPELVGRLADLYRNPSVGARSYGLDADVRVLKFDVNQDGIVDAAAGDRVWLFFGMRRGGQNYYSIDVTDRERPRLRWNLGPAQLPGIGETWSTPTVARVRVQGATQNGERFVLIFGGGYDGAQENYEYTTDSSGNRLFMVDAQTGALLWFAGGPGAAGTPDLPLPAMTHSIPGRVIALDTDGDQFADRLYAGDMGGRVWRFDIWNGRPAAELVTGGVFAALGAGSNADTGILNNRRFYNAPDVALIQRRGADPYYNIAIGSGYRGHPLHLETRDRFYSIRDKNPFGRLTQTQYNEATALLDSQLIDITDNPTATAVPTTAAGWKLEMRLNGGWNGEKILAEATTVDGAILFTSYQPQPSAGADPCLPANGVNRAYALRVDSGKPAIDFNDDQVVDADDLFTQLAQTGIAGEVNLALESVSNHAGGPGDVAAGLDALGRRGFCVVGVEVLRRCVVPGSVVRTFWQRTANNSAD